MSVLGIIVDVIVLLIIVGNAAMYYKIGLTRVVFNVFSTIIAIILVFLLYKPVTNYIYVHTQMAQNLETTIKEKMEGFLPGGSSADINELANSEENGLFKIFMGETSGEFIQNSANDIEIYVASNITYRIISILVYFALFTMIRIVLCILKDYADFLANLPFICIINSTGGMIYGVVKGFLIVYVLFAILSLMMPMISDTVVIKAIEEAWIGSKMFYHNIILNVIFKFL